MTFKNFGCIIAVLRYNDGKEWCDVMKNIVKTLFCMMLACVLALSLASCDKKQKIEKNQEKPATTSSAKKDNSSQNDKQLATETAKAFMTAICNLDMTEAKKYAAESEIKNNELTFGTHDNFRDYVTELFYADMTEEEKNLLSDVVTPVIDTFINEIPKISQYRLSDASKTDEGYSFAVTLIMSDFGKLEEKIRVILSEDEINKTVEDLAITLADKGVITQETPEEEIMNKLFENLSVKLSDSVSGAINDNEKLKIPGELVVVKNGGSWLVDMEKSKLEFKSAIFTDDESKPAGAENK